MNYLSHYLQPKYTTLIEKYNGFYAFGQEQFDRQKKQGYIYLSLDGGLLLGYTLDNPDQSQEAKRAYANQYFDELASILDEAMQEDIQENGLVNIIRRELNNHEAEYTGHIEDAFEALEKYPGITRELVDQCFRNKNFTL